MRNFDLEDKIYSIAKKAKDFGYQWENGKLVVDPGQAKNILKILNSSKKFGKIVAKAVGNEVYLSFPEFKSSNENTSFKQHLLDIINEGVNDNAEQEKDKYEWRKLAQSISDCEHNFKPHWQKVVDRQEKRHSSDESWRTNKAALDAVGELRMAFTKAKIAILKKERG